MANLPHRPKTVAMVCNAVEFARELAECFRNGLDDFLSYPCSDGDVLIRLERLMPGSDDDAVFGGQVQPPRFGGLIGSSPSFLEALSKFPKIAQSRATVLITGETGPARSSWRERSITKVPAAESPSCR